MSQELPDHLPWPAFDAAVPSPGDEADVLVQSGLHAQRGGNVDEAIALYERELALAPDRTDALAQCADLLLSLNRPQEALAKCDRALALQPQHTGLLDAREKAMRALLHFHMASYERGLAASPNDVDLMNTYGNTLLVDGRKQEALALYERSLALKPGHLGALKGRASALHALGRYDEEHACMLEVYQRTLEGRPTNPATFIGQAVTLMETHRFDEAQASFARGVERNPGHVQLLSQQALLSLLLGAFERGWNRFEVRHGRLDDAIAQRPRWTGKEQLLGKTILLRAEQGIGDTIQFMRYVDLVSALGANVNAEVQAPLKTLFADRHRVQVFAQREPLPPFDYQCPMLSLPLAFGTKLDTIPSQRLRANSARVQKWRAHLGDVRGPRIGLTWSGNPRHRNDLHRSFALGELIAHLPRGPHYVSLQKQVRPADEAALASREDIQHFGDLLEDFADTAGLIEALDLVLTVDTGVAHLAGAMGKPV